LKNPLQNLGLFASYGTKKAQEYVGLQGVVDKLSKVRPELKSSADHIEKQTARFGSAVENLLIKYGKNIEDQQIPLKRVAECTMELYAMAAVTSRATRSLEKGLSSASHEVLLANTYCLEASQRINDRLKLLQGGNSDKQLSQIADECFKEENYIPVHPLEI